MITTRQIFVKLAKGRKQFLRVTTKDIDASIKVKLPKDRVGKGPMVSTNKLGDVADIEAKKRRDDIMVEKKRLEETKVKKKPAKVKKAWKDMTDEEKEVVMAERMAKVRAAKGKNKEGKK
ncbi:hypothetical protein KA005_58165 [bacterium]|nr:hypothetical protein [bacterium]